MPKLNLKFIFMVFAISGIFFVFLPGCREESNGDDDSSCFYSLAYTEIENFGCGTISFGNLMEIWWDTTTVTFSTNITVDGTLTYFEVTADWDDVQKNALIPLGSPLVWSPWTNSNVCDYRYAVSFLDITFSSDGSTFGSGADPKTIQIEFEFDLGDPACGPSMCYARFEVSGDAGVPCAM